MKLNMKLLTVLIIFSTYFLGAYSLGSTATPLPKDAKSIQHMAGEISSFSKICPEDFVCATDGTRIEFKFFMHGCVDVLGPFEWHYDEDKSTLYVSATNVHRAFSDEITCIAANVQFKTIDLVGIYPQQIRVIYLGTDIEQDYKL